MDKSHVDACQNHLLKHNVSRSQHSSMQVLVLSSDEKEAVCSADRSMKRYYIGMV